MTERAPGTRFHEELTDWRVLMDGANAFYPTDSFATSLRLVEGIAGVLGQAAAPDVDIRPDGVTVRLLTNTDDFYGMTTTDFDLARSIEGVARDLGLTADPTVPQSLTIIPGAVDRATIMPFWQALLGYEPRPDSPEEDLRDPHRRGPFFWFENMDAPRADGDGNVHLVVTLPHDQRQARMDAALAAGGRVLNDAEAPDFWLLADPAGNQVDIS
jgi:4a-hydroxytetrahydrobiopterin dehydratase